MALIYREGFGENDAFKFESAQLIGICKLAVWVKNNTQTLIGFQCPNLNEKGQCSHYQDKPPCEYPL